MDEERLNVWRGLLAHECDGIEIVSSNGSTLPITLYSTAHARAKLFEAANEVQDEVQDEAKVEDVRKVGVSMTPIVADEGLVTCLFSFGSTGAPKPLWFDAARWAEWGG